MEENKQHIDELFRESLGNYTETPPPAIWDAIEQRLGGEKRRPAAGVMRWWGWLALLLLAVGGGALVMNKYKKSNDGPIAQQTISKPAVQPAGRALQPGRDSLKTAADGAQNAPGNSIVTAQNTVVRRPSSHRHPSHQPDVVHHSQHRSHHRVASSTTTQHIPVIANNSKPTAAVAKNSVRSHRRRDAIQNDHPARSQNHTVEPAAVTGSLEPKVAIADNPKPVASQASRHTRRPQRQTVATAPKPVSNWQKNQPKTRVIAKSNGTDGVATNRNATKPKRVARPAKNSIKAIAAPVVKKPSNITEQPVETSSPSVVKAPVRQPKRRLPKPAKPVVSKPVRQPEPPAVVAARPKKPVEKRIPRPAPTRASRPAVTATVPSAIAKAPRQPRVARTKSNSGSTAGNSGKPRNTTVAVNNTTGQPRNTSGTSQPASLAGRNEDVRFPSARPDEPTPKPKTAAVAPDVTGNPIDDDDADSTGGGEETPYTMNSHRKRADGLGFSAGIAAGYSFGLSNPAPGEVVVAPYLKYKLNERISFRFTPSYRFGTVASLPGASGIYFQNAPAAVQLNVTYVPDSLPGQPFHFDTVRNYQLSQQYDSIRTGGSYGGKTWAIDLPITLEYKLAGGFSLFGGPVFSYQNTVSFTTNQQTFSALKFDSVKTINGPLLDTNILKANFVHGGQPYSAYTDAGFNGSTTFRIGYLAGLRYEYRRVQAEFSIQQNLTGLSNISSIVKNIYTQPYLRFTIGYSLWEPRRRKVETP